MCNPVEMLYFLGKMTIFFYIGLAIVGCILLLNDGDT